MPRHNKKKIVDDEGHELALLEKRINIFRNWVMAEKAAADLAAKQRDRRGESLAWQHHGEALRQARANRQR